jgi:hypothetical protein
MINLARTLLVSLLVVCVPFQAALAVSAAQCMALQHHQDLGGHDAHAHHDGQQHSHGAPQSNPHHDKDSGSHCSPCAGAAAIASAINPVSAATVHGTVNAVPDRPLPGDLPSRLDRPPLAL